MSVLDGIMNRLHNVEHEHNVRILFACESGSRAWGFESTDSDYDVRFVYVRPEDWYLSVNVEHRRDVIELPIDETYDINGWDLRKALRLFLKSNPPFYEWLSSPVMYLQHGDLVDRLRDLAEEAYNPLASHYHYYRMAEKNFREHLRGDTVKRKKYLYVLRPLLAVHWIRRGLGVVPMRFEDLVDGIVDDETLKSEIDELVRIKKAGSEADVGPRLPVIHEFLESELEGPNEDVPEPAPQVSVDRINRLFREIVRSDAPSA